ncbi:hypothetical protein EB796_015274 [Bugula neritina]|uniref:Uncharacterized protein n=1 Tax=Bugula neritina TaxID=10212 RepID=A0A7J7JJB0_BUGNE|nr:hypothetical protein EB796_015274 [Bugula neritina]
MKLLLILCCVFLYSCPLVPKGHRVTVADITLTHLSLRPHSTLRVVCQIPRHPMHLRGPHPIPQTATSSSITVGQLVKPVHIQISVTYILPLNLGQCQQPMTAQLLYLYRTFN